MAGFERLGDSDDHAAVLERPGRVHPLVLEEELLEAECTGDVAALDERGRSFVQVDLGRVRADGQVLAVAGDNAHQAAAIKRIARAQPTHKPPSHLSGGFLSALGERTWI